MKLYKNKKLLVNELDKNIFNEKIRLVAQKECINLLSYYENKDDLIEKENKIIYLFTTILMDAFKADDEELYFICSALDLEIIK